MIRALSTPGLTVVSRGATAAVFDLGSNPRPDYPAVLSEIWNEDVYQLDSIPVDGAVVVDVGAHIGAFTIRAALAGATVVAVEPYHEARELLVRNVQLNNLSHRVHVVSAALVPEGTDGVNVAGIPGTGMGEVVSDGSGALTTAISPRDLLGFSIGLAGPANPRPIGFLKVDIEGGEHAIASDPGFRELLSAAERISFETHPPSVGALLEAILYTHSVSAFGDPSAGGMIHGIRY